mmetsp:Transcript_98859/g.250913  ORF Transcript_98859/g.250913 Transcript_98859/m.250913 type:complete len:214 (-) Transcript_98859:480-1121(-)
MMPELWCKAAQQTGLAERIERWVCPFSKSQIFTVPSKLAVKACVLPFKKPQALNRSVCPRSVCSNFWARKSSKRSAWSDDAANSIPVPGARSTATSLGCSKLTLIWAWALPVSPFTSLTKPSAVPMAINDRGRGATCEDAAAMHVNSASWILLKTLRLSGCTSAAATRLPPPPCQQASDSRNMLNSESRRSASSVLACNCSFNSLFSRPSWVA